MNQLRSFFGSRHGCRRVRFASAFTLSVAGFLANGSTAIAEEPTAKLASSEHRVSPSAIHQLLRSNVVKEAGKVEPGESSDSEQERLRRASASKIGNRTDPRERKFAADHHDGDHHDGDHHDGDHHDGSSHYGSGGDGNSSGAILGSDSDTKGGADEKSTRGASGQGRSVNSAVGMGEETGRSGGSRAESVQIPFGISMAQPGEAPMGGRAPASAAAMGSGSVASGAGASAGGGAVAAAAAGASASASGSAASGNVPQGGGGNVLSPGSYSVLASIPNGQLVVRRLSDNLTGLIDAHGRILAGFGR